MRNLSILAAALGIALLGPGCAGDKTASPQFQDYPAAPTPTPAAGQKLIVTPTEGLSGKVSRVNSSLRFAVLTFPVGHMPALNQRLSLYRHGLKTGEVNITGPQRDDSIVADIVAGDAEAGDDVRNR